MQDINNKIEDKTQISKNSDDCDYLTNLTLFQIGKE